MKIVALADIHCRFAEFAPETLPDADVCVVAGDLTIQGNRNGDERENEAAREWLGSLSVRYGEGNVRAIPGNHDFGLAAKSHWFTYKGGYRWYGIATCVAYDHPELTQWAYTTDNPEMEARAFGQIPPGTDIVVSHCPPLGVLDYGGRLWEKGAWVDVCIGSGCLYDFIKKNQPRLVICGHAHTDGGKSAKIGETLIVNCAEHPMLVEIDEKGARVL